MMAVLRRYWKRLVALVIIALLAWWGWNQWRGGEEVEVESVSVIRQDLVEKLVLSGVVDAHEHVTLRFQAGGLLNWVGVKEGEMVDKYQAVASLDQRSLHKTLQKSLNLYDIQRRTFEQDMEGLDDWELEQDAEVRDDLRRLAEQKQFGLENSVIDVELQDIAKRLAVLTTPIAGMVTRVGEPFAGVNVAASQAEIEVVNPDSMFFYVAADQNEVTELAVGQEVEVVVDAFDDEVFGGFVQFISLTPLSGQSGTVYGIKVDLNRPLPASTRLGMTGDARFVLNSKEAVLTLPFRYVQRDTEGDFVWIDEAGTKQYVEIGSETDELIEIVSGLEEGQMVYLLD